MLSGSGRGVDLAIELATFRWLSNWTLGVLEDEIAVDQRLP
jgi:hypothetical protein